VDLGANQERVAAVSHVQGTIDPPSLRFLAIHRAIGRILNLSGAGDYIDCILRDMDEVGIKENGSTELGQYISLKLGGWLDGVPVC
jgi:hypothetical protein